MLPYGGSGYAEVSATNIQFAVHGLLYFTPRTAKFRPFVLFGPAGVDYRTAGVGNMHVPPVGVPTVLPASLSSKLEPGFQYGIGFKVPINHRFLARFDLTVMNTPTPDFGLPSGPAGLGTLFIPNSGRGENAWQFTTEIAFRGGFHEPPVVVAGEKSGSCHASGAATAAGIGDYRRA